MILEYQNMKIFLQKAMFEIGLRKCLRLKKLKTLCSRHMLLVILIKRNLWNVLQKKLQKNDNKKKKNQKEFRVKK